MINLSKTEEQLTNEVMGKINLSKDKEVLGGHVVNLSKAVVNLSKKNDIDLSNHRARVVAVLDYSGSMYRMYTDGVVQETLNKLIPLGLMFDDNGEVDCYLFEDGYRKLEGMNSGNYGTYVRDIIKPNYRDMGCTCYAPVLRGINKDYFGDGRKVKGLFKGLFGKKTEESVDKNNDPVFVIFITDGSNSDKHDTNEIIRELSSKNIFIQFIGIGDEKFSYLEKLDGLTGRECDNTGFEKFSGLKGLSDSELYNKVLSQYPNWLKARGL